ncbi:hepcidin-like [Nerophis ophidion]|uniref:hepcidin-like n=1 Tax=Nerophis ophidion TaxID=159077 RepID=UPI002AE07975|nr:hepcidin-like [Nerophis ophidion]
MKTLSFAIAVIIALSFILIQESYSSPFAEEEGVAAARSGADVEHFEMPVDEPKLTLKFKRNARDCRWCCNCCRKEPGWCGVCCDW